MTTKIVNLKNNAKKFGIELTSEKIEKFKLFEEFLRGYNSHTNLVSAKDIEIIYEKHFADSLSFGKYISPTKKAKIIDIGSGGGFPVIPMAIILDNCQITSVDSTKKKTDFIVQCAEYLKLENLEVLNTRAEDLAHNHNFRENYDIATARAVGNLTQISELCLPFLKNDGFFIAYKSAKVEEEISNAQNALKILNSKIEEIFEYKLQLNDNFERNLVIIRKHSPISQEFPRSFSAIKNKPL